MRPPHVLFALTVALLKRRMYIEADSSFQPDLPTLLAFRTSGDDFVTSTCMVCDEVKSSSQLSRRLVRER